MQHHSTPPLTRGPASLCTLPASGNSNTIELYNPSPGWGKHDGRGWKTINGAINEAKELSTCLIMNSRLWGRYSVGVTIYVNATLSEDEVKSLWAFVSRNLDRAGVIAFWRREVTPANRVHYHMLLASRHAQDELDATIEAAFPANYRSKQGVRRRFTVAYRFEDDKKAARYVTKARVKGYVNGRWVDDYYAYVGKRTFFFPHVKLRTVGVIGPFWKEKKADLWKKVILHERELAKRITPQLEAEAEELCEAFGPVFKLNDVIRHLAEVEMAYERRVAQQPQVAPPQHRQTPPVIVNVTLPTGVTVNAPVIR